MLVESSKMNPTLHALYINTSSYQSFTELNEDSNYQLRTHISLSTLIQLRGSHL